LALMVVATPNQVPRRLSSRWAGSCFLFGHRTRDTNPTNAPLGPTGLASCHPAHIITVHLQARPPATTRDPQCPDNGPPPAADSPRKGLRPSWFQPAAAASAGRAPRGRRGSRTVARAAKARCRPCKLWCLPLGRPPPGGRYGAGHTNVFYSGFNTACVPARRSGAKKKKIVRFVRTECPISRSRRPRSKWSPGPKTRTQSQSAAESGRTALPIVSFCCRYGPLPPFRPESLFPSSASCT